MEKENKGFVVKRGKDMPLGVSLLNDMFNFAVSMPGSSSCNLVLFKKGETDPAEVIPMEASALGIFTVAVKLPKKSGTTEYEYLYQTGETYFCDPYAAKNKRQGNVWSTAGLCPGRSICTRRRNSSL